MVTVLILFGIPVDESDFDRYFEQSHFAIAAGLPDLRNIRINRVLGAVEGTAAFYLALELCFETAEALQDALNSDLGQTMARDYQHFATGGVDLLVCNLENSPLNAH